MEPENHQELPDNAKLFLPAQNGGWRLNTDHKNSVYVIAIILAIPFVTIILALIYR